MSSLNFIPELIRALIGEGTVRRVNITWLNTGEEILWLAELHRVGTAGCKEGLIITGRGPTILAALTNLTDVCHQALDQGSLGFRVDTTLERSARLRPYLTALQLADE